MSKNSRLSDRLVVGGPPRADLLPPEFAAEARVRAQRRGMVALAVLSVIVVALAYGYVTLLTTVNAQSLASANAETQSLLAQKKDYAEVNSINAQLATIEVAKILATSTEINWKSYLNLVEGSLPPGTQLTGADAFTAYPGNGESTSASPLGFTNIAQINFSAKTTTLPNVSDWIENLSQLPGYAGSKTGSITLDDDGTYTVTMSLYINEDALSTRLPHDEGEEPEPTPDPTDTATPAPTATAARAVVTR